MSGGAPVVRKNALMALGFLLFFVRNWAVGESHGSGPGRKDDYWLNI